MGCGVKHGKGDQVVTEDFPGSSEQFIAQCDHILTVHSPLNVPVYVALTACAAYDLVHIPAVCLMQTGTALNSAGIALMKPLHVQACTESNPMRITLVSATTGEFVASSSAGIGEGCSREVGSGSVDAWEGGQ